MFQTERFIAECQAAIKESDALSAVNELVARVVSEPAQVLRALGRAIRFMVSRVRIMSIGVSNNDTSGAIHGG